MIEVKKNITSYMSAVNKVTFVIGASSGNADSLAKLVRRIFSDAIDLASNPNEVYEPVNQLFLLKAFQIKNSKHKKMWNIYRA